MIATELRYDWDMADFKKRVEDALGEAEGRLEEERRLDQEFRKGWDEIRRSRVKPALKAAAEAMRERPILGDPQLHERDNTIDFRVFRHRRAQHPEWTLTLKPEYQKRVISVTADRELQGDVFEDQEFTMEGLDGDALEAKILLFLEAIARTRVARRNE